MFIFLLVLMCLIASFVFENKKMKVKSIVQLILAIILFFIVFFFLPKAPFEKLAARYIGQRSFMLIQAVLNETFTNFSVVKVIVCAVLFLTVLSIFDIVVFVRERVKISDELTWKTQTKQKYNFVKSSHNDSENKIYLLFCRFLK